MNVPDEGCYARNVLYTLNYISTPYYEYKIIVYTCKKLRSMDSSIDMS
jgi:hypothetical protein